MRLPDKIRFWDCAGNGKTIVQITLRQGEEMTWHENHDTDEGYHFSAVNYKWGKGDAFITRVWFERGRDCDGPYESGTECRVRIVKYPPYIGSRYPVFRIDTFVASYPPVLRTCWKKIDEWNRDYFAEAMGY